MTVDNLYYLTFVWKSPLLICFSPHWSYCKSFSSFSQFSARCRKEWVSIKSSAGGEPLVLCGSKLPQPVEFPGGNITVTHHFLPHLFPVSSFLLNFARGMRAGCFFFFFSFHLYLFWEIWKVFRFLVGKKKKKLIPVFMSFISFYFYFSRLWWMPSNILWVPRRPLPSSLLAL